MNIYQFLERKEHNQHYLKRYLKFVLECNRINSLATPEYFEKHHILPKAKDMFPEYSSFKDNPWNCAILTFRQHLLAHFMLMKAYGTQSQILSFLRTTGQFHARSIKSVNSKLLEIAKIELSKARKGVFTRGYNEDGSAKVSQETKAKLSDNKKKLYSNLEARELQSIACTGKKKTNTSRMKLSANNRSDSHKHNLQSSIKEAWLKKKESGDTKRIKDGIYVTPIGVFTSIPTYRSYCRDADKAFTIHSIKKNTKLNSTVIGMTPRQLGFFFIAKNDITISQYCDDLNQVHLPEPSHPLSSELNDYLLHEKLLPQKEAHIDPLILQSE
jgi:hypothetical protein